MDINWEQLWAHLINRFALDEFTIHGPDHWQRVERHAIDVAEHSGGDLVVVRLFATFHDVCRENDGSDPLHGARGAELAVQLRGTLFDLPDAGFAQFQYACIHHTSGLISDDPTIGACWDADRLDIWRAGITPVAKYMSTAHARELVHKRHIGPKFTPKPR
jgi:uncharacterized protein